MVRAGQICKKNGTYVVNILLIIVNIWLMMGNTNLVGGFNPTPLKNLSSSVGMMTFPIYGKKMVQTTNQIRILRTLKHLRTSTDINIKYHQI